jgi:hypothetical protein
LRQGEGAIGDEYHRLVAVLTAILRVEPIIGVVAFPAANPKKHGLIVGAADWPYSPFQRSGAMGIGLADWAGSEVALRGD